MARGSQLARQQHTNTSPAPSSSSGDLCRGPGGPGGPEGQDGEAAVPGLGQEVEAVVQVVEDEEAVDAVAVPGGGAAVGEAALVAVGGLPLEPPAALALLRAGLLRAVRLLDLLPAPVPARALGDRVARAAEAGEVQPVLPRRLRLGAPHDRQPVHPAVAEVVRVADRLAWEGTRGVSLVLISLSGKGRGRGTGIGGWV